MRMWMVNPRMLCNQHLLGEHNETHAFIGTLNKEISINDYINKNLFEPLSLVKRHNALVNEFIRRGWHGHKTPISEFDLNLKHLSDKQIHTEIDREEALRELLGRCSTCFNEASKLKTKFNLLDAFYTLYSCPYCDGNLKSLTNDCFSPTLTANEKNEITCEHCGYTFKIIPRIDFTITK